MTTQKPTGRQATADDLLKRARQVPGVATVIDVYGELSKYVAPPNLVQTPQTRNATGGNG
jgi:hypothetical protein